MLRIFVRIVVALLILFLLAVAVWIWRAKGCLAWDPPPGSHPAVNCADKGATARFTWFLSFFALSLWAFQPRKRP